MKTALEKQMICIAVTGKGGGDMSTYAHVNIVVPSDHTQRIQELHLHILHTLCSLVEYNLFEKKSRQLKVPVFRPFKMNGHVTKHRVA